MRAKYKHSYINIFRLLLLANTGLRVADCANSLNVEELTIIRYMTRLRKAGYKIRTTRKEGVILNSNIKESEIQNIINLLEVL